MACAIKISGFISPPRLSGAKTAKYTAEIKLQEIEKREQQNYMQNKIGNCRQHTTWPQKQRNFNVASVTQKTSFFITQLCQRMTVNEREGESQ